MSWGLVGLLGHWECRSPPKSCNLLQLLMPTAGAIVATRNALVIGYEGAISIALNYKLRMRSRTGQNVCMVITCSGVWINRIGLSNSARGQLNRRTLYFSVPVCAREFGLARQVRTSCPASACLFSTLRLDLVLTRRIPPALRRGVHLLINTANHHRFSPEFIMSSKCVPMAFTAQSPPAQGQQSSR